MQHEAARISGSGTTIFTEMNELAARFGAANLGQGAPNFDAPAWLRAAGARALEEGQNQYARSAGTLALTEALSARFEREYGLRYDAAAELTVTAGATEALFVALQGLCNPGDEVLVFDPVYDSYPAAIRLAGGVVRAVPLDLARGAAFDAEALERAITPRTRLLMVNSPHNPTGKVFTRRELETLATLAIRHDLVVLSDEVYEDQVFEGEHIPVATLPGMRERTVTISSAGKALSITGWKVGWAAAPAELTRSLRSVHQFVTFCGAAPLQAAVAHALRSPELPAYRAELLASYRRRRELLSTGLSRLGFGVLVPSGAYFVMTDLRPLGLDDGARFCRALPEVAGVSAIPGEALCVEPSLGKPYVRWAFCKTDELLTEALQRLERNLPRLRAQLG